jgi:catechol 1,2-dioxygenase
MPGTRLVVSGRILGASGVEPLEGATLDVWQADSAGHYDNDGVDDVARAAESGAYPFRLRGKLLTSRGGAFRLRTILPGRYRVGAQYRPAHLHVKVSAPGYLPVTTQLYFEDDPYNDVDPLVRRSLIMQLASTRDEKQARFDFVLAKT